MSLYTIVSRGMAGRLSGRLDDPAPGQQQPGGRVLLPGASMWLLQTGLAIMAIATAILIGAGR